MGWLAFCFFYLGPCVVSHSRSVRARFFRARHSWRCIRACHLNARRLARPRPGPRPSRSGCVSSRLLIRPSSVDVARALAPLLSPRRRVSQSRRSWSFLSRPPMAALFLRVCSQCTVPRAPSPRPSAVSLASRLVVVPHSAVLGRRRARSLRTFGSGVVTHSCRVHGRSSRTRQ